MPTWLVFILLMLPAVFPSSAIGYVLAIIWLTGLLGYIYFLANSLFLKLPLVHDLKIKRFRFNFFFVLVYSVFIIVFFKGGYVISQDNFKDYGWMLAIIIPAHLYTMFCVFYIIWFIAKCVATIENNKIVGFESYAGIFFLLWFFPVGIWWVHPKVKKIFAIDIDEA